MEILIRQANPDDAAALVAYGTLLSNEIDSNVEMSPGEFNYTMQEERVILQSYLDMENSIFLVAVSQDDIVGMLSCRGAKRNSRRHAAALSMSVRQDLRGKKIGTLLMTALMEWLEKNVVVTRIELIVFERNKPAIHLYEKFGFVKEGCCRKAIYRNGQYMDMLMMAYLVGENDEEIDTLPVSCW